MTRSLFPRSLAAAAAAVVGTALLAGACSVASAQPPLELYSVMSRAADRIGPDAAFMRDGLQQADTSLRAADLALEQSRDVRVREYAQRAQRDDSALLAGLTRLASQRGALTPATQRRVELPYRHLRGATFDHRFVQDRIERDRLAVATFSREAQAGRDRGLARFAAAMLPMLRRHLAATEALQAQFDLRSRNFPRTQPS